MSLFAINLTVIIYKGANPAQHGPAQQGPAQQSPGNQEKKRKRKLKKKKKKEKKHTIRHIFTFMKHLVMYGLRPPEG